MKKSKKFAGPPILPWFRPDSSRPLASQLSKAMIVEAAADLPFPELRLNRAKSPARPVRKKKKKSGRKTRGN